MVEDFTGLIPGCRIGDFALFALKEADLENVVGFFVLYQMHVVFMLSIPKLNVVDVFAKIIQYFHLLCSFWIAILHAPSCLQATLLIFSILSNKKAKNFLDFCISKQTVHSDYAIFADAFWKNLDEFLADELLFIKV